MTSDIFIEIKVYFYLNIHISWSSKWRQYVSSKVAYNMAAYYARGTKACSMHGVLYSLEIYNTVSLQKTNS